MIGRKGDWIQIFAIMFFVLLLVIAIILLTLEADDLESGRPELEDDLRYQKMEASFTSFLRQPSDQATVASAITLYKDESDPVTKQMQEFVKRDEYSEIKILFPDGREVFIYKDKVVEERGITEWLERFNAEMTQVKAYLPGSGGNIIVAYRVFDRPQSVSGTTADATEEGTAREGFRTPLPSEKM